MHAVYILTREQVGEQAARWFLSSRLADAPDAPPSTVDYLPVHTDQGVTDRGAQAWATRTLYGRMVRTVGWDPLPDIADCQRGYRARTAPWRGSWQVSRYRGASGAVWRVVDGGAWLGRMPAVDRAPRRVASTARLEALDGPLVPLEVYGLAALIAELGVYRAVAGYANGAEECMEASCSDYVTEDGQDQPYPPGRDEYCSHVEHQIATSGETFALHRVRGALDALAGEAQTPPDDQLDKYRQGELDRMEGIRHAVEYVTEAINREDDE